MTLIEFATEAGQLTHNLNETALSLCILKLNLFSLLILLIELLLKHCVFIQGSCQLALILLDDPAANLLVDGLSLRAQILMDKVHAHVLGHRSGR